MKKTFRRTFLTGLFIVLPVLITFWVIGLLFSQVDAAITPTILNLIHLLSVGEWTEAAWVNWISPVVSLAVAVVIIWLIGLVGGNVLGRQLLRGLEHLMMQVPVVRSIYSATRQFIDTFSATKGQAFSRVVLVEYPRKGLWTLGLVTNETTGEVQARTAEHVVSVFLPTTPNPTSGWLVFVPEKDVVPLTMSVDDAFKMVVSGGVLSPPYTPDEALAPAAKTASAS